MTAPIRSGIPRRKADAQATELHVMLRWLKVALVAIVCAAFGFGVWVANLQSQVSKIPLLEAAIQELVAANRDSRDILRDMALLQCSDTQGMNATDREVCARYRVGLPR